MKSKVAECTKELSGRFAGPLPRGPDLHRRRSGARSYAKVSLEKPQVGNAPRFRSMAELAVRLCQNATEKAKVQYGWDLQLPI